MSQFDNYFTLFSLPVELPIDRNTLNRHYQQLQRQYHPDNFVTENESKRLAMLQYSAEINQAYQTLIDPIRSVEYLLSLQGIVNDTEQTIIHNHDFLMQQFALREQLEQIEILSNKDTQQQALSDFSEKTRQLWQQNQQQLFMSIQRTDWSEAAAQLNQLRYLYKLQQDIERLEDKLFEL
ncbi:MAG: Fe-S protein assembly co-chaperone HscB [Candidatus Schmidhempelia sp.]|nr:Fe-S protein assembly co-chaperone HscB [Candidatus Schmidhempelia sp.]